MKWRLFLIDGDAAFNMALDEVLLLSGKPTLRVYRFRPSAVTIGYFQSVKSSVNLDEIKKRGIDLVRRPTGGGAVYHDERGEVTYSVVGPIDLFSRSVEESMRIICGGLINAIRELGLSPDFVPINDIVVNGKKVSGSAQTREGNFLLQHGTLMYNTDLEVLAQLIRPPKQKLEDKGIKDISARVTTLSRELRRKLNFQEVRDAVINGFSFLGELEEGELDENERKMLKNLERKYRDERWNFRR